MSSHLNGYETAEEEIEYGNGQYEEDAEYPEEYQKEEEEEVEEQPTQEELSYLEYRKQLKEKFRKKLKAEAASILGNSHENKKLPNDNFGSFFGPSRPAIAKRVLEERRSLMENQHVISSKKQGVQKDRAPIGENELNHYIPPQRKTVDEVETKLKHLKSSRDYSFLMSDDADIPEPAAKEPASLAQASNARSVSTATKVPTKKHATIGSASGGNTVQQLPKKPVSNGRPTHLKPSPLDRPKVMASSKGDLHGSKMGQGESLKYSSAKTAPSVLNKKAISKSEVARMEKAAMSKTMASAPKQYPDQRKEIRVADKPKMSTRAPSSSLKPQPRPKPPVALPVQDKQLRKPIKRRPFDDSDDDDPEKALSIIRSMFHYNPSKFRDDDDDLSDMEANFHDIEMEEKRSERIAREEDERELRLIEEEERRERQRKAAKLKRLRQQ